MESPTFASPPRRKLSRLKRAAADSEERRANITSQPLEPADNRLNAPQEQISHGEGGSELSPRQRNVLPEGPKAKSNTSESAPERQGTANGESLSNGRAGQMHSPERSKKGDISQTSGGSAAEASSHGVSRASGPATSDSSQEGGGHTSGARASSPSASTKDSEHWDEEDELEAYLRRNQVQLSDAKSAASAPNSEQMLTAGSGGADSGDESQAASGGEDSSPESPTSLAGPELQRKLREQAHRECIGRADPPEIKPMDGVLAKIRAIADAAAARAAETKRVDLPPASAQKLQRAAAQPIEEDDDIIIESDEDLDEDARRERDQAATPSVPLRLAIGSETQQDMLLFEERKLDFGGGQTERRAEPEPEGSLQGDATEKPTRSAEERTEGHLDRPANDVKDLLDGNEEVNEEEEDDASFSDETSSSDEEDENSQEGDPEEARRQAMAEAAAMLKDRKGKSREQYFEDEAEMSEDGGHSEDDSDSEGDKDHEELLEGLIGHERERRGDERLRAAAHAQWLAQQDENDVQRLMDGMKNGFRKPKRPAFMLDTEGDLADSRKRRAALDAGQEGSQGEDESSEESGESESDDDSEKEEQTQKPEEYISDDEARDTLHRYQQQKLLEASQIEEDVNLDLLDDDSQALLSKLLPETQQPTAQERKIAAKTLIDLEEGKMTSNAVSFLGRAACASAAVRANSQNNTRSYIFGADNSNSAQLPEADEDDRRHNKPRGPTSFVGIKRAALPKRPSAGQLLNILHPQTSSIVSAKGEAKNIDISNIIAQPPMSKSKLSRMK